MKNLIKNVETLFGNPKMALLYLRYLFCRLVLNSAPIATFNEGIRFTGFVTFSEYWFRYRGLEIEDREIIERVLATLKKPSVAFDIGANLGLFSLLLARLGFDQVHCYEPIPPTYHRLLGNLELNPSISSKITPYRIGVSQRSEVVEFLIRRTSPGQNKMITRSGKSSYYPETVSCQVSTLEEEFSRLRIKNAGFLKIDVEGHESSVLKGAMPLLKTGCIKFIYTEVIPDALREAGSSVDEFTSLLNEGGFDPVLFNRSTGTFDRISFSEALADARDRRNVLFLHRSPKDS